MPTQLSLQPSGTSALNDAHWALVSTYLLTVSIFACFRQQPHTTGDCTVLWSLLTPLDTHLCLFVSCVCVNSLLTTGDCCCAVPRPQKRSRCGDCQWLLCGCTGRARCRDTGADGCRGDGDSESHRLRSLSLLLLHRHCPRARPCSTGWHQAQHGAVGQHERVEPPDGCSSHCGLHRCGG